MKAITLTNRVNTVINSFGTENIKVRIGDSTNNHRVLTVNQLIRFLSTRRNPSYVNLGKTLSRVYNSNRSTILQVRLDNGLTRTDAIDINELTGFLLGDYIGTEYLAA